MVWNGARESSERGVGVKEVQVDFVNDDSKQRGSGLCEGERSRFIASAVARAKNTSTLITIGSITARLMRKLRKRRGGPFRR